MPSRSVNPDILFNTIKEDQENGNSKASEMLKQAFPGVGDSCDDLASLFGQALMQDDSDKVSLVVTAPPSFSINARTTMNVVSSMIEGAESSILITGYSSDRLQAMVNSLSKKHLEKNYTDDTSVTEKVDASINELNEMFSFFYEEETKTISDDNIEIFPGNDNAFEDKKAELNTWKMIRNSSRANLPGKIFIDKEKKCKFLPIFDLSNQKKSIQEFLDAIRDEEGAKEFVTDLDQKGYLTFVEINVSGECETAQNKLPVTKIIPGVIIDEEIYSEWKKTGELKKTTKKSISEFGRRPSQIFRQIQHEIGK